MIYLELLLGFLKVGCFTFGGAYSAMVDCQASATPKNTSKGERQPSLLRGL